MFPTSLFLATQLDAIRKILMTHMTATECESRITLAKLNSTTIAATYHINEIHNLLHPTVVDTLHDTDPETMEQIIEALQDMHRTLEKVLEGVSRASH